MSCNKTFKCRILSDFKTDSGLKEINAQVGSPGNRPVSRLLTLCLFSYVLTYIAFSGTVTPGNMAAMYIHALPVTWLSRRHVTACFGLLCINVTTQKFVSQSVAVDCPTAPVNSSQFWSQRTDKYFTSGLLELYCESIGSGCVKLRFRWTYSSDIEGLAHW